MLDEEVDRLMTVVDARRKAGQTPFAALKDCLKAVLCSPSFLYLAEPETKCEKMAESENMSQKFEDSKIMEGS